MNTVTGIWHAHIYLELGTWNLSIKVHYHGLDSLRFECSQYDLLQCWGTSSLPLGDSLQFISKDNNNYQSRSKYFTRRHGYVSDLILLNLKDIYFSHTSRQIYRASINRVGYRCELTTDIWWVWNFDERIHPQFGHSGSVGVPFECVFWSTKLSPQDIALSLQMIWNHTDGR